MADLIGVDETWGGVRQKLNEAVPSYLPGNWYQPIAGNVATGAALTANSIRFAPFYIREAVTISDLACHVTTAAAGGLVRLAIYANDPETNRPTGAVLAATPDIATDATGPASAAVSGGSVAFDPGWYWMAVVADATGAAAVFQFLSTTAAQMSHLVGSATLSNISAAGASAVLRLSLANPGAFGTWPDMTAETAAEGASAAAALVFYKVVSVP